MAEGEWRAEIANAAGRLDADLAARRRLRQRANLKYADLPNVYSWNGDSHAYP